MPGVGVLDKSGFKIYYCDERGREHLTGVTEASLHLLDRLVRGCLGEQRGREKLLDQQRVHAGHRPVPRRVPHGEPETTIGQLEGVVPVAGEQALRRDDPACDPHARDFGHGRGQRVPQRRHRRSLLADRGQHAQTHRVQPLSELGHFSRAVAQHGPVVTATGKFSDRAQQPT